MDRSAKFWQEKIRAKGLRLTRQRKEIIRVLQQSEFPLEAGDIHYVLLENDVDLELSTVYRNLQSFLQRGIIREIDLGTGVRHYELNTGEHGHHLICMGCQEIIVLSCPLPRLEEDLSQETSYEIVEHRLNIYGFCPGCREKRQDK